MTVGMSFDPSLLVVGLPVIAGSVAGLLALKAAIVMALARQFGLPTPAAAETAWLLAGTGEFAFVVLALAGEAELIAPAAHQFFVAVAALGLLLTPALALLGSRLARAFAGRGAGEGGSADDYADHVVIGGFGRVGRVVAEVLEAEGIPYVAVDLDAEVVAAERAGGRAVFYGDATRREILDRIGGARARAFVVTTGIAAAEEAMVAAIRRAWPDAVVHARAKDAAHARRLVEVGAANAVPEALEASLQLAARLLVGEGLSEEAIEARLAQMRRTQSAPFRRSTPGGED
jgi:CPA2 family monovalent cation:H+ antiporter-2